MPAARPAALAATSIWPAAVFVTSIDATPLAAVSVPSPVTVPEPPVLANATTVELSEVTVFPAASWIVAVSVFVAPEALDPEASRSIVVAVPWTTENTVLSEVRPAAVAVIVSAPASEPLTSIEATPFDAVAPPRPVTVPLPPDFEKVTAVALSPATSAPSGSRTSTLSVRWAPEGRAAVELVKVRWWGTKAIATESDAAVPAAVPSCGVTSTLTVSPPSPFPASARSSVSVRELEPAVVFTVTPSTFQT